MTHVATDISFTLPVHNLTIINVIMPMPMPLDIEYPRSITMNVMKANRVLNDERSLPDVGTFLSWMGSDILDAQIAIMAAENRVYVLNTSVLYPVEFSPSRFLGP